jgi:hypothetical protein
MPTSTALLKKIDDLREKGDFAAIIKLICAEIAKAKDGKAIEALEKAEAVEDMFLGEDDAGPEVGAALLKRAFAVGGAGGASLLRMLNVISLYDHAEPLAVTSPKNSLRKKGVLSAVEKSIGTLRAGVADKNAAFRAASLYLLLTCNKTTAQDAECVLQCLLKLNGLLIVTMNHMHTNVEALTIATEMSFFIPFEIPLELIDWIELLRLNQTQCQQEHHRRVYRMNELLYLSSFFRSLLTISPLAWQQVELASTRDFVVHRSKWTRHELQSCS